jgi:hypothetical protein
LTDVNWVFIAFAVVAGSLPGGFFGDDAIGMLKNIASWRRALDTKIAAGGVEEFVTMD